MRVRVLGIALLAIAFIAAATLFTLAFRIPTEPETIILNQSLGAIGMSSSTPVEASSSASPKNTPLAPLDAPPSAPLANPPSLVKGIYATSWSAGSEKKLNYLISLIDETELNAIIIDIKDYSGYVSYASDIPEVQQYHAIDLRIPKLNALLAKLHDHGIYTIARVSVFQDSKLAVARPDLALVASSTGTVWKDQKGVSWIDAASKEAWEYNASIAREAFERGFDEVNFDYVRFPSDGALSDISYPVWDGKVPRAKVIRDFWAYLREALPGKHISADLFGLTTVNKDDLGIGQHLEYAFPAFDTIAPMVYPSHYYANSFGFPNPANHPYEIIRASMDKAFARLVAAHAAYDAALTATTTLPSAIPKEPIAKFRPWLQDFNLGATYDAEKVRAQIQATYDSASSTPELFGGWMLWSPSNVYTKGALLAE
jgi:hypothetical protein